MHGMILIEGLKTEKCIYELSRKNNQMFVQMHQNSETSCASSTLKLGVELAQLNRIEKF